MLTRLQRLWPLPALIAWAAAWAFDWLAQWCGASATVAWILASVLGVGLSLIGSGWWRRLLIGLGFPLSVLISGAATLPAWAWLVPLVVLLVIYPIKAWRDAPVFPTPKGALCGLPDKVRLASGAQILDAGCGLGHGLIALRQAYPSARLHGQEWSWPLSWACALRCRWARVRRADIWRESWQGLDLVYLFQRPESMDRAAAKARAELQPGAWLVSLEFEARRWLPHARIHAPDGRPIWIYQSPLRPARPEARSQRP